MHEGCSSRSVLCVCVCVCVCYHTNYYVPRLYVEIKVALTWFPVSFSTQADCVDFIENALFRSFGNIKILLTTSAFFAF